MQFYTYLFKLRDDQLNKCTHYLPSVIIIQFGIIWVQPLFGFVNIPHTYFALKIYLKNTVPVFSYQNRENRFTDVNVH